MMMNVCMVITYSKGKDQQGKVANPARGQRNRENIFSLSPFAPENLVSRDRFGSPVPHQPAHLRTQAESPYVIGSVPSLSGHAIAYRWRSLPRVRRHRVSKPQGSSKRVLPWQVTMDQLICASLPHTHNWYGVGMLKVPANDPLTFVPLCNHERDWYLIGLWLTCCVTV